MKKRIITGIIMLLVLGPLVVMPNPTPYDSNATFFVFFIIFQVMCGLLALVGTHELIKMFETEKPLCRSAKGVAYFLTLTIFLNLGNYWGEFGDLTVPLLDLRITNMAILLFAIFLLLAVFVFDKEFSADQLGKVLLTSAYVGFGVSAIVLLKAVGVRFIIFVLLITTMTDVFAYFFGVAFGKHKMAPTISPKKSWEGAIGGTVMATIIASSFAIFYGHIFPADSVLGAAFNPNGYRTIFDGLSSLGEDRFNVLRPFIIVLIVTLGSVATQIGDLVASKLKRSYDIKDFGNVFPGHGGVLDRFDSLIFVSLLFVGVFLTVQAIFPVVI